MDLSTTYLGMQLRSPLVASASPLSATVLGVRAMADAGVGAVVMYSLFEEQVRSREVEDMMVSAVHENSFGEALSYFPEAPTASYGGAEPYLNLLEQAASAVDVPVVASLNGSTPGGWTGFARSLESAGASAIELNVYAVPGDTETSGAEVEQQHLEILTGVRDAVSVPVAVKLSPYFSSTGAMAVALDEAGADGLVLFNRFLQPEVDVDRIAVVPAAGLSSPAEARLPRTWIAILRGRVRASLAATTGVETGEDVAAYLLAGADVVMSASALLRHGPGYAAVLTDGLTAWLTRKNYDSVDQVRGLLAVGTDVSATAYERAGYVQALQDAHSVYGDLTHV